MKNGVMLYKITKRDSGKKTTNVVRFRKCGVEMDGVEKSQEII
jgi:hypothetical protein